MSAFLRRRRYLFYPGELGDIARTCARGDLVSGSAVAEFEHALAIYHGCTYATTVNSGRVALLILLDGLGLVRGDEILVPAYTLAALIDLLGDAGYVPIPIDVTEGGFNMDPARAAAHIGPRTRAILATHLFGRPCAIVELAALARAHDLLLVEDCAQALGAEVDAVKVGSFGDGAILSFDLLKGVNTFGGGAILTSRPEVAQHVTARVAELEGDGRAVLKRIAAGLAEHGLLLSPLAPALIGLLAHPRSRPLMARAYRTMQHSMRPTRARFSNLQSVIGNRLLDSLDARVAVRRSLASALAELLGEPTPAPRSSGDSGYFFVRRVRGDADELRRRLLRCGIDAGVGGEVADYCGAQAGDDCVNARAAFASAIQLPLHEGLRQPDLERIARACAGQLHPDR